MFSKCGPQTLNSSIIWELFRNAELWGEATRRLKGGERMSWRYLFLWFLPVKSPLSGHVSQCDLLPFWVLVNKKVRGSKKML